MKTPEEILTAILELEMPTEEKVGLLIGCVIAIMKKSNGTKENAIEIISNSWDNLSE